MPIWKLSEEVVALTRSAFVVASLPQALEELIANSIDAEATNIVVSVDAEKFTFEARDNGFGMTAEDMKLLGERYVSSKCHSLEDLENITTFGFRGEALSSIAQTAIVEITSRAKSSYETYQKVIEGGNVLKFGRANSYRATGTTICVRDMFYKNPIRRKVFTNPAAELEKIRQRIERISLVHPTITITLYDLSTNTKVLQTRKVNSTMANFTQLFGVATAGRLEPLPNIPGPDRRFRISGHVSTIQSGHYSKDMQFFYVNNRFVKRTRFHKLISQLFQKYLALVPPELLAQEMENVDGGESATPRQTRVSKRHGSPKKIFDRYPMFVIQLWCSPHEFDITFDPDKTIIEFKEWDVVLERVHNIISDFYYENTSKLISKAAEASRNLADVVTADDAPLPSDPPAAMDDEEPPAPSVSATPARTTKFPLTSPNTSTASTPSFNHYRPPAPPSSGPSRAPMSSYFRSDANRPRPPSMMAPTPPSRPSSVVRIPPTVSPSLKRPPPFPAQRFAYEPKRPRQAPPTPSVDAPTPAPASAPSSTPRTVDRDRGGDSRFFALNERVYTSKPTANQPRILEVGVSIQQNQGMVPQQITKEMLQGMEVINQVDFKFILCRIGRSLYILDQHAVHERIRLEEMQEGIYGADGESRNVAVANVNVKTLVTAREARLLELYRQQLELWGWSFQKEDDSLEVLIETTPQIGESILTTDNLKEYLQQLDATNGSKQAIPKALHRILCSRACRGAVMFGDKLSREDCAKLMEQLTKCDLPFQCAHGRPSVSPLVDVDQIEAYLRDSAQYGSVASPSNRKRPNFARIRREIAFFDRQASPNPSPSSQPVLIDDS